MGMLYDKTNHCIKELEGTFQLHKDENTSFFTCGKTLRRFRWEATRAGYLRHSKQWSGVKLNNNNNNNNNNLYSTYPVLLKALSLTALHIILAREARAAERHG